MIACLVLTACASAGPSTQLARRAGRCAWRVCVTTNETPNGRTYLIKNDEPVPATVVLEFKALRNMESAEGRRVERVVEPRSTEVIRLDRTGRGRTATDLAISIDLGASSTEAEDYVYAVPFGGTVPHRLIQGCGGEETHLGSMRWSLDIEMPPRTPVLAARDGVVLYLQDGFTEGGTDPRLLERANLVVIAHADGSMATYGHLAPGLAVRVGDSVSVGQRLGPSGRTGFAGQPHLHFHVGLRVLGEPGRTIPVRMKDAEGVELYLSEGLLISPGRRSY